MRRCTCMRQHPPRGRASRDCHSKGTEQGLSDCREAWRLRAGRGACGGVRGCAGRRSAWIVCWAALGQGRASPPRLERGGELAARAGRGGAGRAWPWRWRRQRGGVRVRARFKAAPMTTGVLALKTMNVSTLQYCSVLMLANIHARKATDTQKKLWCSTRAHD